MLVKMVCPRCGANLEIDDQQEVISCKYCGYQQVNLTEKVEVTHKIDRSNEPNLYITYNTNNPAVQMVTRIVSTGQKNTYVNGQTMTFHLPTGQQQIVLKIGKKNYNRTIVIPEDNQPVRISASFSGRANIGIDQPQYTDASGKAVTTAPKKKQSLFGILGFILSLTMYLSPVGLGLGIFDQVRAKKDPDHSHSLGRAAVIVGAIMTVVLISVAASTCGGGNSDSAKDTGTDKAVVSAAETTEKGEPAADEETEKTTPAETEKAAEAETEAAAETTAGDLESAKEDLESAKEDLSSAVADLKDALGFGDDGEAEGESEAPSSEVKDFYQVGDEITDNGFRIVYIASGVYHEDNQFLQPDEGKQYIFTKFAFINESKSEKNISYFDFDGYADGYQCDNYYSGDEGLSATLTPGRSTEGYLYFEVPVDAADIEIEYEANVWTDRKIIFKYEGEQDCGYILPKTTERAADAHAVGEVIEGNHVNITYISCEEYTSDNMFIQPKEGNHFMTLTLEFENTGSSDHTVSAFYFDCYADGIACDQTYLESDLSGTLSSGRKLQGTVTFEVPNDAEVIEAEYNDSFWTSNRIIFTVK